MSWSSPTLNRPGIVLCEGQDEVRLLQVLSRDLGIDSLQFIDCGGCVQFHSRIKLVMVAPGRQQVRAIGIVRDAEDDANGAKASVQDRLREQRLPVPDKPLTRAAMEGKPDTVFLIVPPDRPAGMMEDLILECLAEHPAKSCHETFFDCLRHAQVDLSGEPQKRRLQALLAAMPSDGLAKGIGEAAEKGILPMAHPVLSDLRHFLGLVAGN